MAIKARITNVTHEVEVPDVDATGQRTGKTVTVDLSLSGQLQVEAEYFDDANEAEILVTESFRVSAEETEEQIAARIVDYGVRIRQARVRTDELTAHVGQTIDLPQMEAR